MCEWCITYLLNYILLELLDLWFNFLDTVQEADYEETNSSDAFIPRASLLQTSHFTSALQVFSSVGGLALLAEHLPLLYPEFTRQASPVEVTKDPALSNLGHDWVTVESAEEIYEVRSTLLFSLFCQLEKL